MGVYINFGYLVIGFKSTFFKKINLWRKKKNKQSSKQFQFLF